MKWIGKIALDNYGRDWSHLPISARCEECGQPDTCGDCNHEALSVTEVIELGGKVSNRELWTSNEVQFARLLHAVNDLRIQGILRRQAGLTTDEVGSLLQRAVAIWEAAKDRDFK